jgi:peptidoglycan/LPS O-acetylase OafA/YrhL
MEDTFARFLNDVFGRLDGPLHFRFFLQPAMALVFAIRDGLTDARQGRPAYFWSLFTETDLRRDRLRDGWKSISKVFIIAVVLDVIYQLIVLHWFYPFETLLVAVLLALIPYALVRGPVNRIKRSLSTPPPASQQDVGTMKAASASAEDRTGK